MDFHCMLLVDTGSASPAASLWRQYEGACDKHHGDPIWCLLNGFWTGNVWAKLREENVGCLPLSWYYVVFLFVCYFCLYLNWALIINVAWQNECFFSSLNGMCILRSHGCHVPVPCQDINVPKPWMASVGKNNHSCPQLTSISMISVIEFTNKPVKYDTSLFLWFW